MAGMATELGRVPRPVGQVRCCGVGVRPDGAASLHRAVQVSRDRSSDVVAALAEATPGGRDTAAGVVWMAPEAADHVGFPIFARVSLPDLTSLDLTRAGSLDLSACGARLPALNTVLMREDVQNVRLPAELPALSQVSFGRRAPSTLSAPFGGMYADRKPLAEGFLPPSSARNVRRLELTNRRFEAVPAGCAELTHLVIARAAGLRPGAAWLPPCSSGKLTHILASDTNLERIPEGLTQLKYLKVDWCRNLKPDFLPESSAGKIVMLSAAHTPFVKLPPNMHALTELCIIETRAEVRATHWLPATSATQLRILRADACGLERLPEGCAALEELSVSCNPVRQNWLPASSAGKLRILRARGCPQHPLPAAPHLVTHEEGPIGPFPGVFSGEGPIPAGGAGGANPFGLPAGLANFIAMAIFGELFGGPGDDGDGDGADADADGDGDGDGPGGNGPTAVEGPPGTLTIEVPGMPFLVSIGAAPPGLVGMPPPAFMTIGYGSDSESESESSLIEEHQFDVNHPFAHEEEYYSSEEEYY
ncbi:unnamed protein product [Pedinophyceae sp. YPF-701]|nr:unnamed protein product [Pedinophyceae sp. YPF-701]